MSAPFQTRLPASVKPTNVGSGIRSTPAGIEIRLRTPGTRRPKNTERRSWARNQSIERWTSSAPTSGIRSAVASIRSTPQATPSQ